MHLCGRHSARIDIRIDRITWCASCALYLFVTHSLFKIATIGLLEQEDRVG